MRDEAEFGAWLRTRMEARRMSQRQLAAKAGLDHATVSRLVRGQRQVKLGTALRLEAALSVDEPDRVLGRALPLHPARLSRRLRSDGILTDDEIRAVVALYSRLFFAQSRDDINASSR